MLSTSTARGFADHVCPSVAWWQRAAMGVPLAAGVAAGGVAENDGKEGMRGAARRMMSGRPAEAAKKGSRMLGWDNGERAG